MRGADFPARRLAVAAAAAELDRVCARVAELQPSQDAAGDAEAAAVEAAREAVGDARAAALLGGGDQAAMQGAEQALKAAQAAHEQVRARAVEQTAVQAGLQRLQGKAATAHQAVEQALQAALLAWVEAEHAEADALYVTHARAAGAAAARTQALNAYLQGRNKDLPCVADLRHFR